MYNLFSVLRLASWLYCLCSIYCSALWHTKVRIILVVEAFKMNRMLEIENKIKLFSGKFELNVALIKDANGKVLEDEKSTDMIEKTPNSY